ncbi:hypothetical protein EJB05_10007, partial [Eragrostis curvula]
MCFEIRSGVDWSYRNFGPLLYLFEQRPGKIQQAGKLFIPHFPQAFLISPARPEQRDPRMGPTRRHCRVPNNVSEGLSDEAQFSDDDDDDFVEDDLNLMQDTDTEKASDCDDSDSNSSVDHNQVLYLQCLTKIEELEKLKKKLSHSLFQKVAYLDFVNFGTRQPPPAIPRTLVWKQNMIKEYSDLDESTSGVYGARPLLDIANTCYSKKSVFLHTASTSLFQNEDFKSQLDINSGFKLPDSLKHDICKLLDDHSINSSLTINMDITSFGNMSTEMKATFSALLEHSSSVDIRTQTVVLKLLKLLCDFCPAESATGEEANDN